MADVEKEYRQTFKARFRPTASRLKEICEQGRELLENANEDRLGKFTACDVCDVAKISMKESRHEKVS